MNLARVGSFVDLEVAIAYIRVEYAFVTYIRAFRGPLWGGRSWVGGAPGRGPNYPPKAINEELTMPNEKGPEWNYITLVQPNGTDGVRQVKNRLQCKLCEQVFHEGATRIRLHFWQVSGCGVAKCTAAEDKLEPVKKVMQQLNRKKEQQEAQD
eukprot:1160302-Pelagomonas_calceolata.AAC.5